MRIKTKIVHVIELDEMECETVLLALAHTGNPNADLNTLAFHAHSLSNEMQKAMTRIKETDSWDSGRI